MAAALVAATVACGGYDSPSDRRQDDSQGTTHVQETTAPNSTGRTAPTVPAGADPEPIPASISPNDDGSTFTMSLGDTTDLVVADPLAPDPIVEGTSVELSEVTNVAESGVREWEVRSLERGVTTIMGGAQDWTVTIRVS